MLFSDASGRKVVSTATAETVGKIDDYVIDPTGPTVAALLLKKSDGDTLRWADIVAFGADAVTVEAAEKITKGGDDLAELLDKRNHLHKKRVLTTSGDELGVVKDIDFDPSTGTVNTLVLDSDQVAGSRVIGVGSYAVVVEADTGANGSGPASGSAASSPATAPAAPAPADPAPMNAEPAPAEPTSLDLAPSQPGLTLDPPDMSQAQRASYPPRD